MSVTANRIPPTARFIVTLILLGLFGWALLVKLLTIGETAGSAATAGTLLWPFPNVDSTLAVLTSILTFALGFGFGALGSETTDPIAALAHEESARGRALADEIVGRG